MASGTLIASEQLAIKQQGRGVQVRAHGRLA
jgi:hypothetical protein